MRSERQLRWQIAECERAIEELRTFKNCDVDATLVAYLKLKGELEHELGLQSEAAKR